MITSAFFFDSLLPFERFRSGGDEEDRTPDPLRARQVLSQLSYTPILPGSGIAILFLIFFKFLKVPPGTFKIEQQLIELSLLTGVYDTSYSIIFSLERR